MNAQLIQYTFLSAIMISLRRLGAYVFELDTLEAHRRVGGAGEGGERLGEAGRAK